MEKFIDRHSTLSPSGSQPKRLRDNALQVIHGISNTDIWGKACWNNTNASMLVSVVPSPPNTPHSLAYHGDTNSTLGVNFFQKKAGRKNQRTGQKEKNARGDKLERT